MRRVPEQITHVFASENYGWELAWQLNAQYVPVDPSRRNIPVSASAIRANPYENWRFIPPTVRPWFIRHVAVMDDRDLAERLAEDLNTVVVHPYREFWQYTWNEFAGRRDAEPLSEEQIRRGGAATVTALARQANRILIHDLRHIDDLACLERVDLVIADPSRFDPRDDHRLSGTSQPLIMVPAQATAEEIGRILVDTPHLL